MMKAEANWARFSVLFFLLTFLPLAHGATLEELYSFPLTPTHPSAALVQSGGNFYGTTYAGGANNLGVVFKITTNGTLTTLVSFNSINGANPVSSLFPVVGGSFYGTTYTGGASNQGTFFKVTTNGTLTTLASFISTNGANPAGSLVQSGGNFYGTTYAGGANNLGSRVQDHDERDVDHVTFVYQRQWANPYVAWFKAATETSMARLTPGARVTRERCLK